VRLDLLEAADDQRGGVAAAQRVEGEHQGAAALGHEVGAAHEVKCVAMAPSGALATL
jgi:hypothetical protein